jgi:hypothetical protein
VEDFDWATGGRSGAATRVPAISALVGSAVGMLPGVALGEGCRHLQRSPGFNSFDPALAARSVF